jgi:hypothetical protein
MANRTDTNRVWYVSYGSNLLKERFLCYITGGTPEGATRYNIGCTDKSMPLKDQSVSIPYPLYFAETSESWQCAGVAFISATKDAKRPTWGRMYLITGKQFIQVVRQENGLHPEDDSLDLDLAQVRTQKELDVRPSSWYGKVMHLGDKKGHPMFTFTSPQNGEDHPFTSPRENYLTTIGRGIQQTYGYNRNQVVDYFLNKPGVAGNWTKEKLTEQLKLQD